MTRHSEPNFSRDWKDFLHAKEAPPPAILSESILNHVMKDLNPGVWKVFSKLSLVHFLSAMVTLSLCPQFGLRLFGEGMGLMRYFAGLGTFGCPIVCGAFFTGTTLLVASLVLRPEEVRTIRNNTLLEVSAMTFLSLGFFMMFQVEIAAGFAVAWILGAVFGGWATLELGWFLRRKNFFANSSYCNR